MGDWSERHWRSLRLLGVYRQLILATVRFHFPLPLQSKYIFNCFFLLLLPQAAQISRQDSVDHDKEERRERKERKKHGILGVG